MNQAIEIINLPVYTTTGRYLGRVVGVEVDPNNFKIAVYQVATKIKVMRLWRRRLIIAAEQVVSLTKKALIVEETTGINAVKAPQNETGLAAEPTG
jgi:sporulation protein YlmC with PRC-barrel domain